MLPDTVGTLEIVNISKSYGPKLVLNDVSFRVEPGTLIAITGENGSGKSTLLNIIIGILAADLGTVRASGRMGYCPQDSRLFPALTVRETFSYFASAYGLSDGENGRWIATKHEELLFQFGLLAYRNHRMEQLSGGTQQKVNLLISLMHDPDIYILDEPYGGFDLETYDSFLKVMLHLRQAKKSILLVTHMLNDFKHFDRILTLKMGRLV